MNITAAMIEGLVKKIIFDHKEYTDTEFLNSFDTEVFESSISENGYKRLSGELIDDTCPPFQFCIFLGDKMGTVYT